MQDTFASGQRYFSNINSSLPSPNARLEQTSWLRIFLGMIVLWIIEKQAQSKALSQEASIGLLQHHNLCLGLFHLHIHNHLVLHTMLCFMYYIYLSLYITTNSTLLWTTTRISVPFSLTLPTDVEESGDGASGKGDKGGKGGKGR